MIDSFSGEYRFLSNYYPCYVEYDGMTFPSVEAAFQAAKAPDKPTKKKFIDLEPNKAKKLGNAVALRDDWEQVKVKIMEEILRDKFTRHEDLGRKLVETDDEELVEGNWWGDKFWGVCENEGKNMLGILLMKIREELKESD